MSNDTLPNLIVIGAMKCGTTSLHYNLNLHPDIAMTREKELHFFTGGKNWSRGGSWYQSHFSSKAPLRGESSPSYTNTPFNNRVAERMHGLIPEARLIYIVRNPIDRIVSHYIHRISIGEEKRPIDAALDHFSYNRYIQKTRYHYQLSQYLPYYSGSKIYVLTLESLHDDPHATMSAIFRFLNVDDHFQSPKFSQIKHKSSDKGKKNIIGLWLKRLSDSEAARIFPTDVRMRLGRLLYAPFSKKMARPEIGLARQREVMDYLEEDISRLEAHTGLDLRHWRI